MIAVATQARPATPSEEVVPSDLTDRELFAAALGSDGVAEGGRRDRLFRALGGLHGLIGVESFEMAYDGFEAGEAAVLLAALAAAAGGIVVFHTRPSGDPSPSLEDLSFARRMAEAAGIFGMELLDHLVVGGVGRWTSLRDRLD